MGLMRFSVTHALAVTLLSAAAAGTAQASIIVINTVDAPSVPNVANGVDTKNESEFLQTPL